MKEKIQWLNERTKEYDEGKPTVTDSEWDKVYYELKELEQLAQTTLDSSPTKTISYNIVNELKKVKHNHPMLSLDKTKDWNEFLQYFNNLNPHKDVIGMLKLDGLTCSLRYIDGKLVSAETRGNGEIGEDILHNALTIESIPKEIDYKDELIIDGEVLCTFQNFENFSSEYKNPRNFAAGSIRLLDANECAKRNLTFVAWYIVKGFEDMNSLIQKFNQIDNLGFTVVPWTSSFDWDAKDFLIERANECGYPIDGLVGRFDDISFGEGLGSTEHHNKSAMAFKFYDETFLSELIDIDWSIGRSGQITPVAVFKPVNILGTEVSRASLHNLSIMEDILGIPYIGQKVWVYKSNLIIPQIKEAEKKESLNTIPILKYCPACGRLLTEKNNKGVRTLFCEDGQCIGRLENKIEHFFSKKALDAKGISKKTISKLMDWGWVKSLEDMFYLREHEKEWKKKNGFGETSVNKILDSIDNSKNCTWTRFLTGLGVPLVGNSVSKELGKVLNSYKDYRIAIERNYNFDTFPGIGEEIEYQIKHYNYEEADRIAKLMNFVFEKEEEIQEKILKDKIFCITGKLTYYKNRDTLKETIENLGGKVTGSVTNKTSYLINNDFSSQTAKNLKAIQLNVPIITEPQFLKMIGVK